MFTKAEATLTARGVFHRRDAQQVGLTNAQIRHRVAVGAWREVLPNVYCATGCTPSRSVLRHAAVLWAGRGAASSHRSAAALWALDGITEALPEVSVPASRNPRSDFVEVHRVKSFLRNDVTSCEGIRCTGVVRTIIDLARVVSAEELETALETARRRYGTRLEAIHARLEIVDGPGHHGLRRLRQLLALLDGTAACESRLEVKVARSLRQTTLPPPVRQHVVHLFGKRYRLDFAWPHYGLAVECDGRAFHEFQRDRTRWRHLGASGWRVLPVTWDDATSRWHEVLSELTRALDEHQVHSRVS